MASAAASGRKLVVKLRSRQDSSRAAHGQPQQAQLKEAISAIYASSPTPCTLEELFRWAGGMRWSIAHGGRWPATAHEPPFCVIFASVQPSPRPLSLTVQRRGERGGCAAGRGAAHAGGG